MIDSHAHFEMLKDKDGAVERAKQKGVKAIITMASSFNTNQKALNLAEKYKNYIFPCLGLSYIDGKPMLDVGEIIEKNKDKIVGIGEVGLDYYWQQNIDKKENQKRNFEFFIKLANKLNLPVCVHARNSMGDVLDFLKKFKAKKVVMHCFSGTEEELKICMERGYWISFATNVCYSKRLQSLIKSCSLEKMLIETDSPCLHPDHKNPNEPANVWRSVELISKIKDCSFDDVDSITERNTIKAFSLPL